LKGFNDLVLEIAKGQIRIPDLAVEHALRLSIAVTDATSLDSCDRRYVAR